MAYGKRKTGKRRRQKKIQGDIKTKEIEKKKLTSSKNPWKHRNISIKKKKEKREFIRHHL